MDQNQAIGAIVVGIIVIVASFFIQQFYEARGIPMAVVSDRKVPKWLGRLVFWVVGGMMILGGIISLIPVR